MVTAGVFAAEQVPDWTTARYCVVVVKLLYAWDVVVFVIVLHEPPPFVLLSHLTKLPVCPDKVKVPEFDPLHTVAALLIVPVTVADSTVMVTAGVFAAEQAPDWTTARYCVVVVKLLYAWDVVVFVIVLHEPPPLVLLSHLTTLPVCPDKVKVPEFDPLHTVAALLIIPATVAGSTVMVTVTQADVWTGEQADVLLLNLVVVVKFPIVPAAKSSVLPPITTQLFAFKVFSLCHS